MDELHFIPTHCSGFRYLVADYAISGFRVFQFLGSVVQRRHGHKNILEENGGPLSKKFADCCFRA